MVMCQPSACDVVRQVLGYFVRYPDASDSLEGITHWRLAEERIHRAVEETKTALDWLVDEGFLVEEPVRPPIYRLNPALEERAAKFLSAADS
jgi:hypothetical protein